LGIEKSKVTPEMIQAAQEQAKAQLNNGGSGVLDLSQISQTAPRGQDDDTPAMFYEPSDDMSDEEMIEADPDGQMSIPDQFMKEMSEATWPTPTAAVKEVFLLVVIVLVTAGLIIGWDDFLRGFYTNLGFIPRPEDIQSGGENMVLPDGWTSNMSEDDFMNFQDEVGSSSK
jgi:preprotein translocase subunit SecE